MEYFIQTLTKEKFFTQEFLYRKDAGSKPIVIGIPKENMTREPRLPFTPEGVQILVNAGYEVIVETAAGEGINYSDMTFSEAGAFVTDNRTMVFSADVIFKIAAPTTEESEMMKEKAIVFSFLQLRHFSAESFKIMQQKKITAFAYDFLKGDNNLSVAQPICEIEGKAAVGVLSELMSNQHGGKGILLGGIAGIMPVKIIILGAGAVCISAVKAALALGCTIEVFDHNVKNLRDVLQQTNNAALATSVLRPAALSKALRSADAVIACLNTDENQPFIVSEEIVKTMKKGAVIVDITEGGCFETSEHTTLAKPYYTRHGVVHYCLPNISARVARTSSMALSDVLTNEMAEAEQSGGILNYVKRNAGFGAYLYNGILVNPRIGAHFDVASNDINLLFAAF